QVEAEPELFAGLARLRLAWCAVAVGQESAVAASPPPSPGDHEPLAVPQDLAQDHVRGLLPGPRPGGDRHQQVLALPAVAVAGSAVPAPLRAELRVVAKGEARVLVGDADEHHGAAFHCG